jgi:tetratricopeptide (TPR) repeat protein
MDCKGYYFTDPYDRALALNPRHTASRSNKGALLVETGRVDEGMAEYDRALAADPHHPGAWFNRGVAQRRRGENKEAVASYRKAIELNPRDETVWLNLGVALGDGLHQWEPALLAHEEALRLNPEYVKAWFARGNAFRGLKRHSEAIECYRRVRELDPGMRSASLNEGLAWIDSGQREKALECFDAALAVDPAYASAWYEKGVTLDELKRSDEALSCFEKAVECDPSHGDAWNNKGCRLFERERYSEALPCFEKAAGLGIASAGRNVAACRRQLGEPKPEDDLKDVLDAWVNELAPDRDAHKVSDKGSEEWLAEGRKRLDAGRFEEALEPYERARRLGHPGALRPILVCLERLGRGVPEAPGAASNDPEECLRQGEAFLRALECGKALDCLDRSWMLACAAANRDAAGPSGEVALRTFVLHAGRVYKLRADVLERMGRIPEAVAGLEEILRLRPDALEARLVRGRIASLTGRKVGFG